MGGYVLKPLNPIAILKKEYMNKLGGIIRDKKNGKFRGRVIGTIRNTKTGIIISCYLQKNGKIRTVDKL